MKIWHRHTEQPAPDAPAQAVYLVALPGIADFLEGADAPMILPALYTWSHAEGFTDCVDGAPLCAAAYHWARETDLVAELLA